MVRDRMGKGLAVELGKKQWESRAGTCHCWFVGCRRAMLFVRLAAFGICYRREFRSSPLEFTSPPGSQSLHQVTPDNLFVWSKLPSHASKGISHIFTHYLNGKQSKHHCHHQEGEVVVLHKLCGHSFASPPPGHFISTQSYVLFIVIVLTARPSAKPGLPASCPKPTLCPLTPCRIVFPPEVSWPFRYCVNFLFI